MQLDNLGIGYGYRTELNGVVVREGGASPEELWNWRANVRKGIEFFNRAKLSEANNHWNDALEKVSKWEQRNPQLIQEVYPMLIKESTNSTEVGTIVTTIIAGNDYYRETFTSDPTPENEQRTLRDADAIKRYNGGSYFSIYIPSSIDDDNLIPHWEIHKVGNGRDYVNDVCGQRGW